MRDEPVFRGIVGIDIERFSRDEWTDPTRARLRDRLHGLLDKALSEAEIRPSQTFRYDTGDGVWLLTRSDISTARLLHPVVSSLARGLADDNSHAPAAERIRLRIAVHAGEMIQDPYGHTGASFNHAARLLNAETARSILALSAAEDADVVLVASDRVYEDVVRHGYEGIDLAGWQPVRIHAKETVTRAWVCLPGLAAQPDLPAVLTAPRLGPVSLPIPRELPHAPADFIGRTSELGTLRDLLAPSTPSTGKAGRGVGLTVVMSALDGMGGIGKSALAIRAAHQHADAFPDGWLYIDLHGATAGLSPLVPLEALGRMLRALGLDPATIPTEVEEAAARFRSLAADRRLLIVLDNAASAQQVRLLLPGSPTCAVLITSRTILASLEGVRHLHLDVLPVEQAVELLGRIAGKTRVVAEPAAASEVVRLCGYLPLAIRLAGARLAARPTWPVRALAELLADATGRLGELAAGDLAVRASFDLSFHALQHSANPVDHAATAAFGLLSLPDGPDLSVAAASRLLDQPERATRTLLERLVDAHLMESTRPGRYRFHDLLRLYAREHAGTHPEPQRLAALERLLGFYTATAWHTLGLLRPGDQRLTTAEPRWTGGGLQFPDAAAALEWLEAERANLMGAISQGTAIAPAIPAKLITELTRALYGFFEAHSRWADGVQANQTVLQLARRTGDLAGQAYTHHDLGVVSWRLGRYPEALDHHQQALTLFGELDDGYGQAATLNNLGIIEERMGRCAEALAHQQRALLLFGDLGDRHGQAVTLLNLGVVSEQEQLERYAEALTYYQRALTLFGELADRRGQALSLLNLGNVLEKLERYPEALDHSQRALVLFGDLGDRHGQALCLNNLGILDRRMGRYAAALDHHQQTLRIFGELGDRHGQAETMRDLGDALREAGHQHQARQVWQQALELFEELGVPEADGIRARLAALPPELLEPTSHE